MSSDEVSIWAENYIIKSNECAKPFGIDSKLNFNNHINEICKKIEHRLRTMSRFVPYMDFFK